MLNNYYKAIFLNILLALFFSNLLAEERANMHISAVREVANELNLSDFQLGSNESIRDDDGWGNSFGFLFGNNGSRFFSLEYGSTHTNYKGEIEDGVNIDFSPLEGSQYQVLSTSKNIFYDIDLDFQNDFVSIGFTHWDYTEKGRFCEIVNRGEGGGILCFFALAFSTIKVGLIRQKASGEVKIRHKTQNSIFEIATAEYKSGTHRFYEIGWSKDIDFLYFSLLLRNVERPTLEVKDCNVEAVGQLACDRIYAATGNRNKATGVFNAGVLIFGMMF